MKHILIGGQRADISKAPIAINWEYLDLATPGKKYSPFTSTLTLPYTAKNKSLMGYGDVAGATLTKIRAVQDVDLLIGGLKFIKSGTFKVLHSGKEGYTGTITGRNTYIEAIEAYTLDDAIADAAATFTYSTYAAAIAALRTGTITAVNKGFILPRTLEGAISSSIWTIYSAPNGHTHEVWLSAYSVLKAMIDAGVATFRVWEGDEFISLESSALYADLCKLYMPCWNWVLYDGGAAWTLELASGQRLINTKVVDRADLVTFGGKTSWEFIKAVAQLFGCIIYQDQSEISLIPLNHISTNGAIDLSGKVKKEKKYFAIPGHGSANHINYDNDSTLARTTITAPVTPTSEKDLLTLDLMLPGQLWVNQYSKNFFNTDFNEGSFKDKPMLLYDGGDTDYTTITHGTDTETDILLKVLTFMPLSAWWATYQMVASRGIAYDAEVYLDPYTLSRLRPWLLVRVNELGGLFYLNKITGFDPDSGKMAKCQLVRWDDAISYSLSTSAMTFTYYRQSQMITVTSNVSWTVSVIGSGVVLNKYSGGGNDVVTVTSNIYAGITAIIRFNFAGTTVDVSVAMAEMTLDSVAAIGTQTFGASFSPAPTITATSIFSQGPRRVFWAIYKGSTLVNSGYKNFTMLLGTNNYSFTGLTVPADTGTTFTFRVGYESGYYPVSSAQFEITL